MKTPSKKVFRTVPGYALPILSSDTLARLHDCAVLYDVTQLRITPASRLAVAVEDDLLFEQFCTAVTPFMDPLPQNGAIIHSCNNHVRCTHEFEDSGAVVSRLSELEFGADMPAKLKIGVAGCYRCCTMVRIRDIGIFPVARNSSLWTLSFGGNGGRTPRIGDILATRLQQDALIDMISRAVDVYREHALKRERTAPFIERFGLETFREQIKK